METRASYVVVGTFVLILLSGLVVFSLWLARTDFERVYARRLLRAYEGNITRAASAAGKNRRAFWELLRKHDIDARTFRRP